MSLTLRLSYCSRRTTVQRYNSRSLSGSGSRWKHQVKPSRHPASSAVEEDLLRPTSCPPPRPASSASSSTPGGTSRSISYTQASCQTPQTCSCKDKDKCAPYHQRDHRHTALIGATLWLAMPGSSLLICDACLGVFFKHKISFKWMESGCLQTFHFIVIK